MGMELKVTEPAGVHFLEAPAGSARMRCIEDATRLIEACFSNRLRSALLSAPPDRRSSIGARQRPTESLEKLRIHRIRIAAVCTADSRFGEMAAEESRTDSSR
jgi:hypothetical protein